MFGEERTLDGAAQVAGDLGEKRRPVRASEGSKVTSSLLADSGKGPSCEQLPGDGLK